MNLRSKIVAAGLPAIPILPFFLTIALKQNVCSGSYGDSLGPCSASYPMLAAIVLVPPILTAILVRKSKSPGGIVLFTFILWITVWVKLLEGHADVGRLSLTAGILYGLLGVALYFVFCLAMQLLVDRN